MLPSLGHLCLLLAFAAAAYTVAATALAYRVGVGPREAWLGSAHNAALAVWGLLMGATAILITLFLTNDFSVEYVVGHSARAQPIPFKISAFWGGQEGSLLMWAAILATYGLAVAVTGRRARQEIAPTAVAIISAVGIFFIGLIAFVADPFRLVAGIVPLDGRGLNPLLQNYWMQIHPPTLYTGYVGCTVPFAFAAAAVLHRRFDDNWVALVRRWTLFPWIVLTIGIIMGGRWAYETLGWGGYWAWDPVENASLMPCLTATAFLHSIMIQARRGMLKTWNMVLVSLTFLLSVFGTFLTRSGVVSSVHSFAESGIGGYFMGFLAIALVFSFGLIIWRRDDLVSHLEFDSPLSREGAFLLNNWILLGAAFAVLWGTVFPSISEAIAGQSISVGKPYFNRVMVPLGLVLLALTGIGPLMAWRRTSPAALWRTFRIPVLAALLAAPLLWWLSAWHTGAATSFLLAVFVVVAIGSEFARGARARQAMTGESLPLGFLNLLLKNKKRYGGYIVHLGIVMLFVGITGSSAFQIETDPIEMSPGQELHVGEYTVRFAGLVQPRALTPDKESEVAAQMVVLRDGREIGKLYPTIVQFKAASASNPEAMAGQPAQQAQRPAIMSNPAADLYLAFTGISSTGAATIKAFLNPLTMWIWISTIFFIGGTVLSMVPERSRARRAVESPLASNGAPAGSALPAPTAVPVVAAALPGAERAVREGL